MGRIHLVDRYLILIMVILFVYSVYGIFGGQPDTMLSTTIDLAVRTTIASIFGYFISVNFVGRQSTPDKDNVSPPIEATQPPEAAPVPDVAPTPEVAPSPVVVQQPAVDTPSPQITLLQENTSRDNLQIQIVGVICVLSLLVVIAARHLETVQDSVIPYMAQLRDIVCGCVGFLLGMPTTDPKK